MVSIAQTSPKEIERLQTDVVTTNKGLTMLTQHVMHKKLLMYVFMRRVNDNAS